MSTRIYVLLAFFGISLIASIAVPVKVIRKICGCFTIPLLGAAATFILLNYMPNSFHIVIRTGASIALFSIAAIFETLESKKSLFPLYTLFQMLAIVPLADLYRTIFYLIHVPRYYLIAGPAVYLVLLILTYSFMRNQKAYHYIMTFMLFVFEGALNLLALLLLIYESGKFSAFLFAGTTLLTVQTIYKSVIRNRFTFKFLPYIGSTLFVLSQVFIQLGSILLIAT